jgi:ParB-like chromosome segregation protein Spo0J
MNTKKSAPQMWKISKLKEYPLQATMFGDMPEAELAALAESMEDGLRDPVEILPDGAIVCGHQRVRAAQLLGWAEIDVVVLHDLAEAGPEAIETHLIVDNLIRRQLSPLGLARCIRRMVEVEQHRRAGDLRWERKEALKKKIADRMHMSSRNVNRYLLSLEAPIVVQHALDRGEIQLTTAGKVALLPKRDQEAIAQKISSGEKAAEVVAAHLGHGRQAKNEVGRALARLVGALIREVPRLAERLDDIKPRSLVRRLDVLRAANDLLGELIERAGEGS